MLKNRGFSCDIISSKFCKSSYSRPPCWFPVCMRRHWEKQQNIPYLIFSAYLPNYNWVARILAHTHTWWKLQLFPWSTSKVQAFFVVCLHTALRKRKPRDVAASCACKCVPRCANPLKSLFRFTCKTHIWQNRDCGHVDYMLEQADIWHW